MSTKIGIIAEGPIDHELLPPLLERIARDRVGYSWPLDADDVSESFNIRKRGHGGVLETVRRLIAVLSEECFDHEFYVILLDRRTRSVQEEIASLLQNHDRFVIGIAIEEIESWWLADRINTLRWAALEGCLPPECRYATEGYHAEQDDEPKKTLDELTQRSSRFDRTYGDGNLDHAAEFARDYWKEFARLNDIKIQCSTGYRPFERKVVQKFRAAKRSHDFKNHRGGQDAGPTARV